jgi:hypothetical protein
MKNVIKLVTEDELTAYLVRPIQSGLQHEADEQWLLDFGCEESKCRTHMGSVDIDRD